MPDEYDEYQELDDHGNVRAHQPRVWTAQDPHYLESHIATPLFLKKGQSEQAPQRFSSYQEFTGSSLGDTSSAFGKVVKSYYDEKSFREVAPCYAAVVTSISQGTIDALLAKCRDVKLLCYPQEETVDSSALSTEWAEILKACEKSRRVFALIDLPASVTDAATVLATPQSVCGTALGYGAAYWPPAYSYDKSYLPVSGMVAAAIHTTDRDRGIWKAPANITLKGAYATALPPFAADESDFVNDVSMGINGLRMFPGFGVKIWGCRTLMEDQNQQRSFVQTSRSLNYIEENITRICRYFVFEPNNEITWVKIRSLVHGWLKQFWVKGGLMGAVEKDAFSVRVGLNDSMIMDDIVNGQLKVNIAVAPQKPAQFVQLDLALSGDVIVATYS